MNILDKYYYINSQQFLSKREKNSKQNQYLRATFVFLFIYTRSYNNIYHSQMFDANWLQIPTIPILNHRVQLFYVYRYSKVINLFSVLTSCALLTGNLKYIHIDIHKYTDVSKHIATSNQILGLFHHSSVKMLSNRKAI